MVALWLIGVNGVFHNNEAREHVQTSHSAGEAAQSQGKQATDKDWNSNMQCTVNLVSSTDQFSMFNFLFESNNTKCIYFPKIQFFCSISLVS